MRPKGSEQEQQGSYAPPLRVCSAELAELNIPHSWSMMEDMRGMSEDKTSLGGQLCPSRRRTSRARVQLLFGDRSYQ